MDRGQASQNGTKRLDIGYRYKSEPTRLPRQRFTRHCKQACDWPLTYRENMQVANASSLTQSVPYAIARDARIYLKLSDQPGRYNRAASYLKQQSVCVETMLRTSLLG
jgi:hypothetical protein